MKNTQVEINKEVQKEKNSQRGANSQKNLGNTLSNVIVSNKSKNVNFTSDNDVFEYLIGNLDKKIDRMCNKYVRDDNSFGDIKGNIYNVVWDEISRKTRDSEGYLLDSKNERIENILGYALTIIGFRLKDYNRVKSNDTHLSNEEKKLKGKVRELQGISENYTNQEIADILKVEIEDIEKSLINLKGCVYLDEECSNDKGSYTVADTTGCIEKGYEQVEAEMVLEDIDKSLIFLHKVGEIDDIHVDIYYSIKEDIFEGRKIELKKLAKKHNMSTSAICQRKNAMFSKIKKMYPQGGALLD